MIRKTLTILSLVGLVLSLVMWGVSYFNVSCVSVDAKSMRFCSLSSGLIIFVWVPELWGLQSSISSDGFKSWNTVWWPYSSSYRERPPGGYAIAVPLWMPILLFAGVGCGLLPHHHRRRCRKLGLCMKCGYDLRGSKDRCPECGTGFETG